jgi:hypothetical protein
VQQKHGRSILGPLSVKDIQVIRANCLVDRFVCKLSRRCTANARQTDKTVAANHAEESEAAVTALSSAYLREREARFG